MKQFRRLAVPLALIPLLVLVSCGDTDPEAGFDEGPTRDTTTGVRLVKADAGPAFDGAATTIVSPEEGAILTGDSIEVVIEQAGVELGAPTAGEGSNGLAYSVDGQHLHVIVNDQPYMAMYSVPFKIGGLPDGTHTMIVFPSRSWHESVKSPGAVAVRRFSVGSAGEDDGFDSEKATLVYSRPKGSYVGQDAAQIMLDFYLLNVTLADDGYRVLVSIDGQEPDTVSSWQPHLIEGLTDGDHSINLSLINAEGLIVTNGPFREISRTISVQSKEKPEKKKVEEKSDDDDPDLEGDLIDAGRHIQGL